MGLNCRGLDFTISSYNCGGLPEHYDYVRTFPVQKLMQLRYNQESVTMADFYNIQNCALKKLFGSLGEIQAAEREWVENEYSNLSILLCLRSLQAAQMKDGIICQKK